MKRSPGSRRSAVRNTLNPPTPLSNMPMGRFFRSVSMQINAPFRFYYNAKRVRMQEKQKAAQQAA